jgi:hypothetical protein
MRRPLFFVFVLLFSVGLAGACSGNRSSVSAPPSQVPRDLLGLTVGMPKEAAERRLREIASLSSEGLKGQQAWKLRSDPHFDYLAVGFDADERVRFVTGLVNAKTARERLRFESVGDLTLAKSEVVGPHHRYIWHMPADGDNPPFYVSVYGDNPETVSSYTIIGLAASREDEDYEQEEKYEKEEARRPS